MHYLRVSGGFIPRLRVEFPHPGFFNGLLKPKSCFLVCFSRCRCAATQESLHL